MFYREWTQRPEGRRGIMLSLRQVDEMTRAPDAGYASVYMFDEASARTILESKSSAGLDRFPVYTDTLVIDLDNGDKQLKLTAEALAVLGLSYSLYFSGGKGYHVVIPLTGLVSGKNVPFSQRKWVEALNVGADLSLYQHGRILSLPGRKHPKTGKRKHLVKTVKGRALELPLLEMPEPVFNFGAGEIAGGELGAGLWKLINLMELEPEPGNRHTKLWSAALHLAGAGLELDTVLDLMLRVNEGWDNPKDESEVRAAVEQAYKR